MTRRIPRWLWPWSPQRTSAEGLAPGDRHYRAWVGPPGNYDLLGALQFSLLVELGLREWHSLLDIGCGSLRAGRLFIPYLEPGRYHGLEPQRWAVAQGFRYELGRDIRRLKRPTFRHDSDFVLTRFGQTFDYILAQSVFTHAAGWQIRRCVSQAGQVLARDGLFAATYLPGNTDHSGEHWLYPDVTRYTPTFIERAASEAGLAVRPLRWYHPGVTRPQWIVFGSKEALAALPNEMCSSGSPLCG